MERDHQQEANMAIKKSIVLLKHEIQELAHGKEQLQEKLKEAHDENSQMYNQIQNMIGKKEVMDEVDQTEELELTRQMKIDNLNRQLDDQEEENAEMQEQLFKTQEELLELKFEKENFDLKEARLQKRIQVLEQYKLTTAELSAEFRKKLEEDEKEIEDATQKTGDVKKRDGLKMKPAKKTKTISDMEITIEGLKRALEKVKEENADLRKRNTVFEGHGQRVANEKSLRQKINNLEQLVHSYEMKDVNLDEHQRIIKSLTHANKQLVETAKREEARYRLLEEKYRDALLKATAYGESSQYNERLVFGMTTGSNFGNYKDFMMKSEKKRGYGDEEE